MDQDNVLRELPRIGTYRVRLIQDARGPRLDVREYVEEDSFEGFTRRGIRLSLEQARELSASLAQILEPATAPTAAPIVAPMSAEDFARAFNAAPVIVEEVCPGAAYCAGCSKCAQAAPPVKAKPAPAPIQRPPRPIVLRKAHKTAAPTSPELAALQARARRGEIIPLTGPGSLAEALERAKKQQG